MKQKKIIVLLTFFHVKKVTPDKYTVSTHKPACCCCLVAHSCLALCNPMDLAASQVSLSFTICWSLLRLMSIESMMSSNYPTLCHPLLLLPSIFPQIRVFYSELALCMRWPNFWSFSIRLTNEYLGLISFRIDWLDLLAVQGTLKSLL